MGACGGSKTKADSPPTEPVPSQPAPDAFPLAAEAVAGIADPVLSSLLRDHWDHAMKSSPVWASSLGDHRFDDRLTDNSNAAVLKRREMASAFLARGKAIDPTGLSALEQTSLLLLVDELRRGLDRAVCDSHQWEVSAFGNPIASTGSLPDRHKIATEKDADNLIARYRMIPTVVDNAITNLKLGASRGLFANAESVKRALTQIDSVLAKPVDKWALLSPATNSKVLGALSEERKTAWLKELWTVVDGPVKQAFARYRAFLAAEILPNGRDATKATLAGLPMGEACYRARTADYLGIERTADELHKLGLTEIKRINQEMRALGKLLFSTDDLGRITTRLRTDPTLYFKSQNEIMEAARSALAAARAKTPEYFGITPKADCVVTPIPEFEAPFSTIAYYRQPHADGSQPGKYFINTYKPEVRPRFEMKVLAYHEAIPGHHLQIAIAQERTAIPAFRRSLGLTAFVEGWALYTERLAGEMGLYETDLDRMGMLSYDAWRAARLVVDTGLHAKGWTREQAEEYMREHTALTGDNIVNEVDRYINWPGQALAYKVGQLEILSLRKEARAALGDKFDIKGFHDVVLREGAVSLPVLAANVRAWVASLK